MSERNSKNKNKKSQKSFVSQKIQIFCKEFILQRKSFLFLNILNMQFDPSSPVQPNPEKKILKKKYQNYEREKKSSKKIAILLVLPIDEISL